VSIIVSCSACNVRLTLGDDRAGDRFECPNCDASIKVPSGAPASSAPPLDPDPAPGRSGRTVARIGIPAGVAALLIVGAAALAFRTPAESATREAEPAPPAGGVPAAASGGAVPVAASVHPPHQSEPPGAGRKADPPRQSVDPKEPPTQYNAQFLGSQGQGRRFCIIADYSNSMRGEKLARVKTQLVKTIGDLNPEAEFYVFGFNAKPEPMPHPTWLKAGAPETGKVKEWVQGLGTRLGTVPLPAFEAAFRLGPPPDVIFFMTDGQFAAAVPGQVAALNGTPPKTVVNTILFAGGKEGAKAGNAENLLKQIATKAGGTFTRYTP
jgi:hypothetical protein